MKLKTILEKFKDDFKRLIDKTLEENVEYGFMICKRDDELIKRGETIGKKRTVYLKNCGEGEERIASFHTHPLKKPVIPSPDDIFPPTSILGIFGIPEDQVVCIGGVEENKKIVRCFDTDSISKEVKEEEKKLERGEKVRTWERLIRDGMKEGKIKYIEEVL